MAKELILQTEAARAAYDEMTPAGKAAFRKVHAQTTAMAVMDIRARWEIGEEVRKALENEQRYGAGVVCVSSALPTTINRICYQASTMVSAA